MNKINQSNKKFSNTWFLLTIIPAFFSTYGSIYRNIILILSSIIMTFLLVIIIPFCRKRENLWMFLFHAFISIPTNILLAKNIGYYYAYEILEFKVFFVPFSIFFFFVVLSIEEVIISIITRAIWRKQKRTLLPD